MKESKEEILHNFRHYISFVKTFDLDRRLRSLDQLLNNKIISKIEYKTVLKEVYNNGK